MFILSYLLDTKKCVAAVSCSPDAYRLGGAELGIWLKGKLGRAWYWCMALVHGVLVQGILGQNIKECFVTILKILQIKQLHSL